MLRKKFYIPIGLGILAIAAIGFLSLRSDVSDGLVKVYKATKPVARSSGSSSAATVKTSFSASPPLDTYEAGHETPLSGSASDTYTDSEPQGNEEIEIEQLRAEVADLKKIIAEKRAILTEVKNFNAWVERVDLRSSFSELLSLRSLPTEEIREKYSAAEFRAIAVDNASRFNAIRDEFLTRVENYSPGARAIIYEQIHSDPVSSQIYRDYIENPWVDGVPK